jgi:tetratricopeptide (TPR) repeat protein
VPENRSRLAKKSTDGRDAERRVLTWALCALLGLATTAAAQNGEQSRPDPSEPGRLGPGQATNPRAAAEQIAEGNKLLDQGDYRGALSAYDRAAEKLPDAAEVPYNRGVALYRMGEFEKAGQAFQNSLKPGHPALEARAKYNLGRCAHAAAMQKHDDLPAAINELSRAIGFYGDAMQLAPQDEDARKNQQLAQRLREYLRRRLEEQKKENPTSQPSSQPSSQPTSQPSSQPTSQPQQGEQQQGDQQEQDSKGEEKQDQAAKDQKQQGAKGKEDEKDKDKEGAAAQEEHKYTPEEAEKRLQEAREMERQRREELRQEQMHTQGRVRVQKDW